MSTSVNIFRNTHSSSYSGGGKEEQSKSVTITENGTTTITPDEGKTLSRVEVTTAVQAAIGKAVWSYSNGSFERLLISDPPGGSQYYCSVYNETDIIVTTDENEPDANLSNLLASTHIYETIGSSLLVNFYTEEGGIKGIYIHYDNIVNFFIPK